MSKLVKCDRCGATVDVLLSDSYGPIPPRGWREIGGSHILCPACLKALEEWLKLLPCPQCEVLAKHAHSTPGFLFTKCAKHREPSTARSQKTDEDFLRMFLEVENLPPLTPHYHTVVLAAMAAFAQFRVNENPAAQADLCGEFAAPAFHPLVGFRPCELLRGHEGKHMPGGTCTVHGRYLGEKCPKCPD
jgi:hypothetical protein